MIYINNNCMSCGMCLEYCKHDAIKLNSTFGYAQAKIDQVKCKQCKACLKVDCPAEAIKEIIEK